MSSLTLEYVLAARAARQDQQHNQHHPRQQHNQHGDSSFLSSSSAAGASSGSSAGQQPGLPEPQALLDIIKRSGAFAQLAEAVGSQLDAFQTGSINDSSNNSNTSNSKNTENDQIGAVQSAAGNNQVSWPRSEVLSTTLNGVFLEQRRSFVVGCQTTSYLPLV